MTPRTPTLPPTEPAMWRKLLARTHPDTGGSHELFVWAGALRELICDGELRMGPEPEPRDNPSRRREASTQRTAPGTDDKPRVPYPAGTDFEEGTREALRMAEDLGEFHPYGALLGMLADTRGAEHYAPQEHRGASYRQLAAIAHAVGMSKPERAGWYRLAEGIPLADRHAGHLLGRLKRQAA